MRNAHFFFSKWRQVAKPPGIFAPQKVPTDPTPWGVVSQGTGGAGNSALQKFPSADGEIFRWRRSREAIRGFGTNPFLLWANSAKQICGGEKFRKTEFREAFASFFAPTRSKKKRTNVFVQFLFDMPFV